MTHPFDQEEKVCAIHNRQKIITKRQTESKAIIVTLECPECGETMELSDDLKTLVYIIKHQNQVAYLLRELAREFERRADIHDQSKLNLDELEGFYQLDLKRHHQKEEYGSKKYESGMQIDAVKLHLSRNSHHIEYHPNGLSNMSFADVIEMLIDWEVARQARDTETSMNKTWETRQNRFNLSDNEIYFLRTIWEKIQWERK